MKIRKKERIQACYHDYPNCEIWYSELRRMLFSKRESLRIRDTSKKEWFKECVFQNRDNAKEETNYRNNQPGS